MRSAIIYGANASGKSNLMKAMQALLNLVLSPAGRAPDKPFEEYEPFLFNSRTASAPVSFDVNFLQEKVRYICKYLIELFHDPKINTKGAQLLLATHDTNLLSSVNFRRGQVWIIEKDQAGASECVVVPHLTMTTDFHAD